MRIKFNSGSWTGEEHQGVLRGLEMYGRGSWEAIGIFVPSRSPLQIEANARQHFAGVESVQPEEVQVAQCAPSGQAPFSCPWSSSSSSSGPSRDAGSGGGGGGSSLLEPPVGAHLVYGVPAFHPEEELCHRHIGICDATAVAILDGLMAVANGGVYAQQLQLQQQQQQASMHGEGYQVGEPAGNLVSHGMPYPHRRIWEEPALGQGLRSWCALDDFGGVL